MSRAELDPTLYHSFARRKGEDGDERSLAILQSILDLGLLITPEIVPWVTSGGTPFRVAQKRVCLTALEADSLETHAKIFGDISIGFDRRAIEALGATPVFYVPRSRTGNQQASNVGGFYVERVYQLLTVVADAKQRGAQLGPKDKPINLQDVENFTRLLSTMFYPIEDIEESKERYYFAQREWRIQGNVYYFDRPLSRRLSPEEEARIADIDPEFFRSALEFPTGQYPLIKQCLIVDRIADRPVREAITTVVTTERLRSRVESTLVAAGVCPQIQVIPD